MNKSVFLILLTTVLLTGCVKDDSICPEDGGGTSEKLISPNLRASINNGVEQSPMTGILEVYPCLPGTSTYYGNYINGSLTPFNGRYTIQDGEIFGTSTRPIFLPVGTYNMIYWGTPKYEEPIFAEPAIKEPQIIIGEDMSQQYFGLFPSVGDTTYRPVFDLVFAVKSTKIGSEELNAALSREVAGIKVIVKNKNNGILSSNIASMKVHIGGIAEKINFFTAEPVNQTKTVTFPLVLSTDGTQMSNATVMVFPSSAAPLFQLFITLKTGEVKTYKQNLTSSLKANTKLTLTLVLGDIFSEGGSGSFTLDNWQEETQTIDIPTLD